MIKDKLDVAVSQCIEAAGHEIDADKQKTLMRVCVTDSFTLNSITLMRVFVTDSFTLNSITLMRVCVADSFDLEFNIFSPIYGQTRHVMYTVKPHLSGPHLSGIFTYSDTCLGTNYDFIFVSL